jgi:hypothetical protein
LGPERGRHADLGEQDASPGYQKQNEQGKTKHAKQRRPLSDNNTPGRKRRGQQQLD